MQVKLEAPYVIFLGDVSTEHYAKTGQGLVFWCPEKCIGQLRYPTCAADLHIPDMDVAEAARQGARTLIIGVAPIGGQIQKSWLPTLKEALKAGLDIASGMHSHLKDMPELQTLAHEHGCRLIDIRVPPDNLPVGNGEKRSGLRLLTMGTDCAIGKKFTAITIARAMMKAGFNVTSRATGQTGIMIEGAGIPIDAVVADFISGAAEILSPANAPDHWDIIEGQGSLFHPGYAAVTLGLLLGSQPDAIVLCHKAGAEEIDGFPGLKIPPVNYCIDYILATARLTNPDARLVGLAINCADMPASDRPDYLDKLSQETGLPALDPVADGVDLILKEIQKIGS